MVLYHPIPMYDVNSLFLLASWAMWLLNSYSVMAGGNANGSFRRILAGIVLSTVHQEWLHQSCRSITCMSSSLMPI